MPPHSIFILFPYILIGVLLGIGIMAYRADKKWMPPAKAKSFWQQLKEWRDAS